MSKRLRKLILGVAVIGLLISSTMTSAAADATDKFENEVVNDEQVTIDLNYEIPQDKWDEFTSKIGSADILVTKDCTTFLIDHGHAALAASADKTIEHYGPKKKGLPGADGLSDEYPIGDVWRHCKTVRLYSYDEMVHPTNYRIVAYARNNLIGKAYNLTANKSSEDEVNCATLVYQAYKSEGYTFKGYWDGNLNTIIPSDFVEQNPHLKMKAQIDWGGDEHTW